MTLPITRPLPPRVESIDPELVECYMEETRQSRRIVTAFLTYDLEPPTREKTTTMGFSSWENRILDATREDDPDPLDEVDTSLANPKAKR